MRRLTAVTATLVRFDLRRYLLGGLLWMPYSALPIVSGLVLRHMFDDLSAGRLPLLLCAAFVGVELVRGLAIVIAWTYGDYWWSAAAALLRANVLRSILVGRGRPPRSPGEALARLRDDVDDVVDFVDQSVPLAGAVLFTATALGIMVSVHPAATLALLLPIVAIGVLSRLIGRLHQRAAERGAAVTAHLGDVFGGISAIKTAGAEEAALERLRHRNRLRRDAAVRDRVAADLLDTATGASVEIGIGLMLLAVVPAMRAGDFTVGDLALFTTYIGWLTALPQTLGAILARRPQAAVSAGRLAELMAAGDDLAADSGVWFRRTPPVPAPRSEPLELLEIRGLTADGLPPVDLDLRPGTLTAVTGPVGSGKSTLLRVLLGLEPARSGTLHWNGLPIAFLTPAHAAHIPQVPHLFSATLRENLLHGHPPDRLPQALHQSVLAPDLEAMPEGLDTLVGPHGTRLSGGQAQRAAVARALVRTPPLLLIDDLSSALDPETEHLLWTRLPTTTALLVVTHHPAVLTRADRVLTLTP